MIYESFVLDPVATAPGSVSVVRFTGYALRLPLIPAMNRWAIFDRPLNADSMAGRPKAFRTSGGIAEDFLGKAVPGEENSY